MVVLPIFPLCYLACHTGEQYQEVENIPTFIELIHCKNGPVLIGFQRVDGYLLNFAFFLTINRNQLFLRKVFLQFCYQILKADFVGLRYSKS